MLHTKSGIPRLITRRKTTDADCRSKTSNERTDCIRPTTTTDAINKDSHIEANSERITDCSESSTAKMACKTMISTRATKTGSKESLSTNLEVGGNNYSESSYIKPVSRRTFISAPPASRAKSVPGIGASTDFKITDCRLKSLASGLQVVPNPRSRPSLRTVARPTASGMIQPNLLSYDHDKQNGDQRSENGSDESCQSVINHETVQSEARSLNKFLQLFIGETETFAESLKKEITYTTE